jgi:oxygen-independent coproporphyrinogen-3 oxidase
VNLLEKYNVSVPRYTSYPSVPFWNNDIDANNWKNIFTHQFSSSNNNEGITLYIHLPFCESLCTYCGCNKKITTNHSVEADYMQAIIKEWKLYYALMNEKPVLRELHLGGGTPTFFSAANLETLLRAILKDAIIHPQHEFSFEGHPNNTTKEHLIVLYNLGFKRVSFGVQDHDAKVQKVINRIQPFENVQRATEDARSIGYSSVNFDLIYGLPLQTLESIEKTILQTISLKPDRIAFYSYAHVPWTSKAQRLFDENDLPDAALKMQLYQSAKKLFTEHSYTNIGMDHFALPTDDLYKVWKEGRLHRNFMGYTTQHTNMLLGLGVSSISDAGMAFAQNHKTLHNYYASILKEELAVTKGYFLNEEDAAFRKYILDISCNAETKFRKEDLPVLRQYTFNELSKLEQDELVIWNEKGLYVTKAGRQFIRNICKAFDLHLLRNEQTEEKKLFSKAI